MRIYVNECVNAYPWSRDDAGYFRGYFIYEQKLYRGEDALHFLSNYMDSYSLSEIGNLLRCLNGVFSFIIMQDELVYFGVDRLRGLPLFYTIQEGELWVGDDVRHLVENLKQPQINQTAKADLMDTCLFVLGEETLIQNVCQVQASEFCCFDSKDSIVKKLRYFHTIHSDFYDDNDLGVLKDQFNEAYHATGKDLVKALQGRTAVIPLSGGADSRMVASMLKEQGYENVICYTYGTPGNRESLMSKAVAENLGYKWFFVPYSASIFAQLRSDEEMSRYSDYAFMFSSTPHFQDYYAVRELKRQGVLPVDSVFVPGHSGDIPNGNHVAPLYMKECVTKLECLKNMCHFAYAKNEKVHRSRMLSHYPLPDAGTPQDYASIEEWMDTAERQAKFIVHSVRVYEFFGYEWLIPLWDNYQFDYWQKVSLKWRYKRRLYYYIVDDHLPSTNDVTFKKQFEAKMRTLPGIHQIASRIRRIQNWWISPSQMEHFFTAKEYFKACLTKKSTFDFNMLYSELLIHDLEKRFSNN